METVYFDDLAAGDVFWGDAAPVDHDEMMDYNRRNDPWPFHVDEEAAAQTPFGGVIASGGYTITLMYRSLNGVYNTPTRRWAFLGGLEWRLKFTRPVRAGDVLRAKLTVKDARRSTKPGRGVVTNLNEMVNQDGEVAMSVEAVVLVRTRPE